MKLQTISIISVLLIITQSVYSISLRQQNTVLPVTPKGSELQNNYGQPANNKVYGALNQNIIPGVTQLTVLQANGKTAQIQVKNGDLNKVQSSECQVKKDPQYQICSQLNDCDLCSNSDVCGWCAATAQCLPGNIGNAKCPGDCISHWIFERGTCTGKVKSGSIGNVAVNATGLITPEYSEPKVRVNTHTTEHATINTQVQVGVQNINSTTKVQALNGTLVSSSVQKSIPIMGVVSKQIPINSKTESATFSLLDGRKLDAVADNSTLTTFGKI